MSEVLTVELENLEVHPLQAPRLVDPHDTRDVVGLNLNIRRVLIPLRHHHLDDLLGPITRDGVVRVRFRGDVRGWKLWVKCWIDFIQ